MTLLEFERSLDRWGAQLDRWPAAQARQARALLTVSQDAAEQLRAAAEVEQFLGALRAHHTPDDLAGRIVARLPSAAATPDRLEAALRWLGGARWRPAVAALLVTGAGYLAGMQVSAPTADTELAEAATTLAFSDVYAEWQAAGALNLREEANDGQP